MIRDLSIWKSMSDYNFTSVWMHTDAFVSEMISDSELFNWDHEHVNIIVARTWTSWYLDCKVCSSHSGTKAVPKH